MSVNWSRWVVLRGCSAYLLPAGSHVAGICSPVSRDSPLQGVAAIWHCEVALLGDNSCPSSDYYLVPSVCISFQPPCCSAVTRATSGSLTHSNSVKHLYEILSILLFTGRQPSVWYAEICWFSLRWFEIFLTFGGFFKWFAIYKLTFCTYCTYLLNHQSELFGPASPEDRRWAWRQ